MTDKTELVEKINDQRISDALEGNVKRIQDLPENVPDNAKQFSIAPGVKYSVYPDCKMTLQEWFEYIGRLVLEDRRKSIEEDKRYD